MNRKLTFAIAFASLAFTQLAGFAEDWPRFRGPDGAGIATGSASIPTAWSPKANLAWKTEMPGPGASSPIIIGGKAFLTCYSGYGLAQRNPGNIENLKRHLVCVDLETGKKLWQKDIDAARPEDAYTGIGVTAHGYASHTPVSDGKNVYAFFGKSGVHAFDMDGKELWQADVGKESDPTKWGSSSSPILYKDTVIVTASAESQAIVGLDKKTGKELWRQEAKGLDGMWGTPTLVKIDDNRTDLVMCVAKELWGLDPSNGELRWYADATGAQHSYASVITDGKRVFAFTSRGGGSIAIDAGGKGNISKTNTVWTGRDTAGYASPVWHKSKLYSISRGIVTVVDAKTGKRVQRLRLRGMAQTGGRFGSLDYPSPIIVGDRMFSMNGSGQMFVFELGDELKLASVNRVTTEKEIFWGTPAVSKGRMLIRSAKYLYCVANKGEKVDANDNLTVKAEDAGVQDREAGGQRGGKRGGKQRFDPMQMFNQLDADKNGKVSEKELEGNRMADRLKTLDKDGDKSISKDEFSSGITTLFRRSGGGGGRGNSPRDTRPKRPQRPKSAGG